MKKIVLIALAIVTTSAVAQQQPKPEKQSTTVTAFPPLFVLDGKVLPAKVKVGPDSTQLVSPMESIDPNNIDKIEVLNGTAATEKFGDAGKNGVVLISTKKKPQGAKTN